MSSFRVHPAFQDNLDVLGGVHAAVMERHFGERVKAMFGAAVALQQNHRLLINVDETTPSALQLLQETDRKVRWG